MKSSTIFDENFSVDIPSLLKDSLIVKTFKVKQELDVRGGSYSSTNDLRFFVALDSTTHIAITFEISNSYKFTVYYDGSQEAEKKMVRLTSNKLARANIEYAVEIVIHRKSTSGPSQIQFDSSDIVLLAEK